MPKIPVVSITYDKAREVLQQYTNAKDLSRDFWYGLPLNTSAELNFKAKVEVNRVDVVTSLNNVIGTIPGRYEPTRYVIIASHHDSWHEGASKPGVGHAVLMELVRAFGYVRLHHGWQPGKHP
jgi:hypothetical protein